MAKAKDYAGILDGSIEVMFKHAAKLVMQTPSMASYLIRMGIYQEKAAAERKRRAVAGLVVPPIMIASITNRCNLNCKGCYNRAQHRPLGEELSAEEWRRVFAEAKDLGISIVLLAGGEPLMRPEILDVAGDFPEIIFPVFTNGMLVDATFISRLRSARNLIPILSIEGQEEETDQRRGDGVYDRLRHGMSALRDEGIFMGTSLTVTGRNYDLVTSDAFIQECVDAGCRLFFFVEYVPVQAGTEALVLSGEQKEGLLAASHRFRTVFPGLFVAFPGDEEEMGGCVAAGRGFVHVSASGDVEPCPFSPYSDVNLRVASIKDALNSRFLGAIRQDEVKISRTKGGCALFENREWVRSLLPQGK